jgi:hypothetical protein
VAQIFISYSKKDPRPTRDVAAFLEREGYSVWWDADLTSGQAFGDIIDKELDAAHAAIVIWTIDSVKSKWVRAEARHADRHGKLIPLRTKDLEIWQIPKPFSEYHTDLVDDREAILKAVRRILGAGTYEAVEETDDGDLDPQVYHRPTRTTLEPLEPSPLRGLWASAVALALLSLTAVGRVFFEIAVRWRGIVLACIFFLTLWLAIQTFLLIGARWYGTGNGTGRVVQALQAKEFSGKIGIWGGPNDMGVPPDENLALVDPSEIPDFQRYFLPRQPSGTTGLARRLDPTSYYISARWNYTITSKPFLKTHLVIVKNPRNGKSAEAQPVDWGPDAMSGRVADISPGLATYLGLTVDDEAVIEIP